MQYIYESWGLRMKANDIHDFAGVTESRFRVFIGVTASVRQDVTYPAPLHDWRQNPARLVSGTRDDRCHVPDMACGTTYQDRFTVNYVTTVY